MDKKNFFKSVLTSEFEKNRDFRWFFLCVLSAPLRVSVANPFSHRPITRTSRRPMDGPRNAGALLRSGHPHPGPLPQAGEGGYTGACRANAPRRLLAVRALRRQVPERVVGDLVDERPAGGGPEVV